MKPRNIIIITVAIIVFACACVWTYVYFIGSNGGSLPAADTGSVTGGNEVAVPSSQVLSNTPTGTLLTLGTPNGSVQVNNFYLSDPLVTDGGETVILASTTEYLITYDTTDSSFWIGIDPSQFDAIRPIAEQALLSVLGVSSTAACKLDVSVGTFYRASSSLNGQSFPLSFCAVFNSNQ